MNKTDNKSPTATKTVNLHHVDLNLLLIFDNLMSTGSVSQTAEKLSRSQSAVSHALARLRTQLDDPLLVKVGQQMQPSPYAETLAKEVRPILRRLQEVISPQSSFDPAHSTRTFRVAMADFSGGFLATFHQRLARLAPHVVIRWEELSDTTLRDVADGYVDVATVPQGIKLPDGISTATLGTLEWACFMRKDHPANTDWHAKRWGDFGHIVVGVSDNLRSPVTEAAAKQDTTRQVAVTLPNFDAVAPLLANSDLLATLPAVVLVDLLDAYSLIMRPPPFAIAGMPNIITWSARLHNDPAITWLREVINEVFSEQIQKANESFSNAG